MCREITVLQQGDTRTSAVRKHGDCNELCLLFDNIYQPIRQVGCANCFKSFHVRSQKGTPMPLNNRIAKIGLSDRILEGFGKMRMMIIMC